MKQARDVLLALPVVTAMMLAGTVATGAEEPPAKPASPKSAAAPATVPAQGPAAAPSPEDVARGAALIARAVEGIGGAAAVDGVKTLELRGKGTRKAPTGPEVLPVETTTRILYPDRYRQDLTLPFGTMSTIITPKEGFLLAGEMGAMPLPEEQRAALSTSFRRNLVTLLRARKAPSFAAVKTGTATVDGTAVELVKVNESGETVTLAVDPASGHVLRASYPNAKAGVGPPGELSISYSDFRKAGSLVYPFTSIGMLNGEKVYESKLESVVVDGPLCQYGIVLRLASNYSHISHVPFIAGPGVRDVDQSYFHMDSEFLHLHMWLHGTLEKKGWPIRDNFTRLGPATGKTGHSRGPRQDQRCEFFTESLHRPVITPSHAEAQDYFIWLSGPIRARTKR